MRFTAHAFVVALVAVLFSANANAQNTFAPPWNQTTETARAIATETPTTLGVATFLVPAPEIGILEEKVVTVVDVTFSEASKRAAGLAAFQWHTSEEWDAITADPDFDAAKSCGLWGAGGRQCPSGCMCGSGNHCSRKGYAEP